MGILGTIGSALWSGTKAVGEAGAKATLVAADYTAIGAYKLGKGMAKGAARLAKGTYEARNERGMNNTIGKEITTLSAMARGMGDWQSSKDVYNAATGELKHHNGEFKLGKFGAAAFFGTAAVSCTVGASQEYLDGRVGASDGQVVTATPVIKARQYSIDNAGATGDLVFALHNNRHG